MFEEFGREFAARRQEIIAANPELQERELIKLASLAGAVAQALRERGVGEPVAILTAEAGMTVFRVAFERCVDPANEKAAIHLGTGGAPTSTTSRRASSSCALSPQLAGPA